jgi:hypothetical protein
MGVGRRRHPEELVMLNKMSSLANLMLAMIPSFAIGFAALHDLARTA